MRIGGIPAQVVYAGLIAPGQFQFNIMIPASTPNGDQSIEATYNGQTTQSGTLVTVHN